MVLKPVVHEGDDHFDQGTLILRKAFTNLRKASLGRMVFQNVGLGIRIGMKTERVLFRSEVALGDSIEILEQLRDILAFAFHAHRTLESRESQENFFVLIINDLYACAVPRMPT